MQTVRYISRKGGKAKEETMIEKEIPRELWCSIPAYKVHISLDPARLEDVCDMALALSSIDAD